MSQATNMARTIVALEARLAEWAEHFSEWPTAKEARAEMVSMFERLAEVERERDESDAELLDTHNRAEAAEGALRAMPEHLEAQIEWLEGIERDGAEPMSVGATTALCHARVLLEDTRAALGS